MSVPDAEAARVAAQRLEDVAECLYRRGLSARMLVTDDKLRMWVQNCSVSQLSDAVYAAPAEDGSWWLWWSWADPIAPIDDVESAAAKIAYVLTTA
jgi:hypothetical protein